ncbi:MAG: O-antigen ligase family protein [Chloroflexi bacterium]|nr:O-antigen ligase family protein [Chloroflexota bacterium]
MPTRILSVKRDLRQLKLADFEPLWLLAAWALFASAESYRPYMGLGFGLLGLSWVIHIQSPRLGLGGRSSPASHLAWPLTLFAVTATLALWAAYDNETALRQYGFILVSIATFYGVMQWCVSPRRLHQAAASLTFAAAALALYFITQRDWAHETVKFEAATEVGIAIGRLIPRAGLHSPHPNIVASVLVVGLLVGLAAAREAAGWGRRALAVGLGIIAFGLLMTGSRGSWLALVLTSLLWGIWRGAKRFGAGGRWLFVILVVAAPISAALAIVYAHDFLVYLFDALVGATDPGTVRLVVWENSIPLVRDYLYTGSGLGTFPMVYQAYAYVSNGPLIPHAHNLFLQVAIEQGVLGLSALLYLLGRTALYAFRRGIPSARVGRGALWATVALMLVWLVDAPGYGDRAAPFLFVGLSLAYAAWSLEIPPIDPKGFRNPSGLGLSPAADLMALAALSALLILWVGGQPLAAAYANAGALIQTRTELPQLADPKHIHPALDEARLAADLNTATGLLEQAQAIAPSDRTANERLGAIAWSLGDYEKSKLVLQAAYAGGSRTRATRLLLADALISLGLVGDALDVAGRLEDVANHFALHAQGYQQSGDWQRAADNFSAALYWAPGNQQWAYQEREARKRIQP